MIAVQHICLYGAKCACRPVQAADGNTTWLVVQPHALWSPYSRDNGYVAVSKKYGEIGSSNLTPRSGVSALKRS